MNAAMNGFRNGLPVSPYSAVLLLALWAAGLCLALPTHAAEQDGTWGRVETEVRERGRAMRQDAAATRSAVAEDRRGRTLTLEQRRERVLALQREYDARAALLDGLLQEKAALDEELGLEREAIRALEGIIRQAAKDADAMLDGNPLAGIGPDRRTVVERLLADHAYPDMETIRGLAEVFLEEMALGRGVHRLEGGFIGLDGTASSGELLVASRFGAFYRDAGGEVGVLLPGKGGGPLRALEGGLPGSARSAVREYFDGGGEELPLDLVEGDAFRRQASSEGVLEWLGSGGFLVWPILLVGVAGLGLGLARFITLGSSRAFSERRMREIVDLVEGGEFDAGKAYCARGKAFPACRVLGRALDHVGMSQEVLENALQEAILQELPRLERFLPTMQVLAAIAPLLGLLGTVTGMINTFQVITHFGTGDPRMMSGGISEALITTQLGLAVAIPIMVLHHFLERRVDTVLGDMEQKGTAFTVTLLKAGAVVEHGDNAFLRSAEAA
jgi:biopolymer transport protein ExbB